MRTSCCRRRARARIRALVAAVAPLLLGITLAAQPARGEDGRSGPGTFRVNWHHRPDALTATIEGQVHNDSPFRVTDVRLRVEGLDAEHRRIGERVVWVFGDIDPGGESTYVVDPIPGAVEYRVTVTSYDRVSAGQPAPARASGTSPTR